MKDSSMMKEWKPGDRLGYVTTIFKEYLISIGTSKNGTRR